MAIGKDVRLDGYQIADCAFRWKSPALDFRTNSFYYNANPPVRWEHSDFVKHI